MEKYLDATLSFKERAKALVDEMTLEEKVFQTLHGAAAIERLGIKGYNWWNEALHGVARAGVATVFPQAIALAASFDEDMMEKVGDVISTEARAKFNMQQEYGDTDIYKGLTFWTPNVNIFRDPRWGRGHETYGEDPYLTGRLAVRFIGGMQGHDEKYLKVASCAKHFAVHSGPEEMRHFFNAEVSGKDLFETYLPAFKAAVTEAHVEIIMGAYNRTNGEACCASPTLLKKILRKKWGFDGHVTSDCWALKDIHEGHMLTNGPEESVALAMKNGCDLNCGDLNIHLLKACQDGLITEEEISEAVVHLYTTKMRLGIFDPKEANPYSKIPFDVVDCDEHRAFNEETSSKCITLLKNRNKTLPLKLDDIRSIAVIGPNADNRKALIGNYEGTSSEYITILEGIRNYIKENDAEDKVRVRFAEGCHLFKDRMTGLAKADDRLAEARAVAKLSDVVVLCIGLDPGLEGEEGDEGNEFASGDKPNLKLPGRQLELIRTIREDCKDKPVIVVSTSGSAIDLSYADDNADAVLQAWYPGARGGNAVASVLFGKRCPEGKLPVTFYRTSEELPAFTDYAMRGRTYRYMENEALYPFGYGLSYTDFELSDVCLSTDEISEKNDCEISLNIRNTGKYDGAETVQVYVKAVAHPDAPKYQLKGLKKIALKSGESRKVTLSLSPKDFALYEESGALVLNRGEYVVYVGTCQPDERSAELKNTRVSEFKVSCSASKILEGPVE